MFSNYFFPPSEEVMRIKEQSNTGTIGSIISVFDGNDFPNLDHAKIAIFGVNDSRGTGLDADIKMNVFREKFYQLYAGSWNFPIIDLGDFKVGKSLDDTYFGLTDLISNLISVGILPIVIGGGHDLCYSIYRAYESFNKGVNIASIDSKFDLISEDISRLNSRNFLGFIVKQSPNHLNTYTNIGFQSYFVHNNESHEMDKMFFETLRLGDFRKNIEESEAYLRNADIITFDMSSIRQADAPSVISPSPNGFFAHEACVLSRYSGISDRSTSFGIFELNCGKEKNNQTSSLAAQIVWHFLEGFSLRIGDFPSGKKLTTNFHKYLVPIDQGDYQFVFYKSKLSGRWWMSSETDSENNSFRETIVPCSYQDYLDAVDGKIPSRMTRLLRLI